MEVIVKNSQLSKTHISKMCYNSINNILACNIDGNDTILFYSLNSQAMSFVQIFKGMSKPPGSKISMSWSPDGRYLALGGGNVQVWQLKDGRLKPIKSYQQDFIQIKIIEWSVDSQNYACGGISRTNTIKIRNIETGKIKQLNLPQQQTISSISFDPYGKYLLLLLRNNTIQVYSVLNYERQKAIGLSPQGLKINPIKQIRTPSWSPDYNYFLCPSLDDSRINIAVNLSRSKDFKAKNVFMGHCTSISCCKFSPKLYMWNGQVTAIVAMGDSAGNVSIWRVGNKSQYSTPLLISNSLQNSMEVVQDIQWDDRGEILMVNMIKKYIHLIKFVHKEKDFGIQLSNDKVFTLIQQTYGSNRATDVNNKQIQIFDMTNYYPDNIQQQKNIQSKKHIWQQQNKQIITPQIHEVIRPQTHEIIRPQTREKINQTNKNQGMDIQKELSINIVKSYQAQNINVSQPNKMQIQEELIQTNANVHEYKKDSRGQNVNRVVIPVNIMSETKDEYVKLSQQKTTLGKDNKKRIQPAMMIRKNQINNLNLNQPLVNSLNLGSSINSMANSMFFTNSMVQTFPNLQLPPIAFCQKQISLNRHMILDIKKMAKATSLQLVDLLQGNQFLARRMFPSTIDYVHTSKNYIYVVNQQFLYIFDLELNPKQLPLKVSNIHKFITNDEGQVYYINCNGYLIGFNHVKNINKTLAPVPLHLLLRQNGQGQLNQNQQILSIKQFTLTNHSDILVTVQPGKGSKSQKRQKYLYDVNKNSWVKLQLKEGILQLGFSIKITDNEQNLVKNFFKSLCPSLKQKQYIQQVGCLASNQANPSLVTNSVLSSYEQQMIYYSKYQRDQNRFEDALISHLNSLKDQHKNNQLRNLIHQYFHDNRSLNFIRLEKQKERLWQRVRRQVAGNIVEQFIHQNTVQQHIQQQ